MSHEPLIGLKGVNIDSISKSKMGVQVVVTCSRHSLKQVPKSPITPKSREWSRFKAAGEQLKQLQRSLKGLQLVRVDIKSFSFDDQYQYSFIKSKK